MFAIWSPRNLCQRNIGAFNTTRSRYRKEHVKLVVVTNTNYSLDSGEFRKGLPREAFYVGAKER